MIMSNESFNNPGIAPAMSQLSGLRKLHLWFYTKDSVSLRTSDVQAHIVWHLVRNVRVSELLIVKLAERQRIQRLRLENETMGLLASGSVRASRGGEDPSSIVGCATPVAGHEGGGGVAESQVCAPGQGVLGVGMARRGRRHDEGR